MSEYIKYRGNCKEFALKAIQEDPSLTLVRGYYWCPFSNKKEQHWWCKRPDGTIHDPSKLQFLSKGLGEYTEFDGFVECAQCGATILEQDASFQGRYPLCRNNNCISAFLGV